MSNTSTTQPSKGLSRARWAAQVLLAVAFGMAGLTIVTNVVLGGMASFVAWGRLGAAPIPAR